MATTTDNEQQFSGSNYAELENYLQQQISASKPETPEQEKKRKRREKWEGVISGISDMGMALSNLFFTSQYAPNMYDGTNGMSVRAKERFEKAKAEREKDRERFMNYALTLGKIKDADRDFQFKAGQAKQTQENWQKQFDAGRKDRADDVAFRDKKFDSDNDHWQKGFDENKRQFDVTSKEHERHNRASEGLERQRIAASQDGKYTEFYSGNGMVRIPNTRLNQHNISYVFSKTPSAGRPTGGYNISPGQTTPVSADQMMDWIGSNIDDPNVQSALRAIGGVTTTEDNTPPSRRNNNQNTPPSRR